MWASRPSIWRRPLLIFVASRAEMLEKDKESSDSMMIAGGKPGKKGRKRRRRVNGGGRVSVARKMPQI